LVHPLASLLIKLTIFSKAENLSFAIIIESKVGNLYKNRNTVQ
jgi:hypothetical protein